mgnify:FL=1
METLDENVMDSQASLFDDEYDTMQMLSSSNNMSGSAMKPQHKF